uniref:Uncharacterized protein n=1 Tax=Periophthalmus magnuspinnatus TaxID=409849 RepID=A0A3B3Z9B7_9GOBI
RIYLTALVGFLLAQTAEAVVGSSEGSVCNETPQCLLFNTVCKSQNFEVSIRRYDPVKWVSVSCRSTTAFWWSGQISAFWDLKGYLDGNPSLMYVFLYMFTTGEYTMSFLLPSVHQSNPPQPTNSRVKIVETGDMYVINMSSIEKPHYVVGYNGVHIITHVSHVSLWIVVDGVPQC